MDDRWNQASWMNWERSDASQALLVDAFVMFHHALLSTKPHKAHKKQFEIW